MRLAPAQIARTVVGGEERIKESLSATRAQHLPVRMCHCSRRALRFPLWGERGLPSRRETFSVSLSSSQDGSRSRFMEL
jgi:hypothetical protein